MAVSVAKTGFKNLLSAAVYISFLIFVLAGTYRLGLSHYYASTANRTGSDADIAAAITYDPGSPMGPRTEGDVQLRKKRFRGCRLRI